jgi:homoserine O-acetyltransferase
VWAFVAALLLAALSVSAQILPATGAAPLLDPGHPLWNRQAPEVFRVRFETNEGTFVVEAHRSWAPRGVDRFYQLVTSGFFDNSRFYRVVPGYIAQFGLPGNPAVTALWKDRAIADDPAPQVPQSNVRGTFAFAMTGPDTRTTQLYVNLADNTKLDAQGFRPLGRVIAGMEVVDHLYSGYGEGAGGGMRGGKQGKIVASGNAHLDAEYPKLSRLLHAHLLEESASPTLTPTEWDCKLPDFRFASGETLPELRLHYTTLGQPARDAAGVVRNAVLILHGTSGDGKGFLREAFAGKLFGPGQLLDATTHYIVLPDGIGHGKSSKPSDGLHMRFPKYAYDDMVRAHHELLTQCLKVDHLRLVMGTSMGGMHTWVWGETYPDFMDALMPLASLPVEIAGRNRMLRKMAIDSITGDPEWKGGEYPAGPGGATGEPRGLYGAIEVMIFLTSSPLQWQKEAPTRAKAEAFLDTLVQRYSTTLDANDLVYQLDASRLYNPYPHLGDIRAPLFAVNSADDQVNPPELGILDEAIHHVPKGRYILLPITAETRGHGTHSLPAIWGRYLQELLEISQRPAGKP